MAKMRDVRGFFASHHCGGRLMRLFDDGFGLFAKVLQEKDRKASAR